MMFGSVAQPLFVHEGMVGLTGFLCIIALLEGDGHVARLEA